MEHERTVMKNIERLACHEAIHPAWGLEHCIRTYNLAISIAAAERIRIDPLVLRIAAYLHDFGAYPRYRKEGVDHAIRSMEVAEGLLRKEKLDENRMKIVMKIIESHMFYSVPDSTIAEAVVFHDSDVLDLLGNVGIERMHSIIGIDDWAKTPGDAESRLHMFKDELPAKVITKTGKDLAQHKVGEMEAYFAAKKQVD